MNLRALLAVNLAAMLAAAAATGPVIGVAVANGTFRVDSSEVKGNSTLFDGARIETSEASSRLRLDTGVRVELGAGSRATVFRNHALLEKGFGEVAAASDYELQALGLSIAGADKRAVVRVRVDGAKSILVSAVNGPARVSKAGLLLARVTPGAALRLEPLAGQETGFSVSGCLLRKVGRYIVVDQTANVTFEVTGSSAQLGPEVGNRVRITGIADPVTPVVPGASQVIRLSTIDQVGIGGCVAAAAAAGADAPGTAAAGPAEAAKSGGSKTAIIAGVAIAAGGGAVAGIVLAGKNKSKSP